jgi:hypothetical protein
VPISIRIEKHVKGKAGELVSIPILKPLAASSAATTTDDLTFLATARGTPFVKESFGTWFRGACLEAGCPGSAHGLRKAGATRAAEHGPTELQLMAIFVDDWQDGAALHPRRRPQAPRARRAQLLLPAQTENEKRRT